MEFLLKTFILNYIIRLFITSFVTSFASSEHNSSELNQNVISGYGFHRLSRWSYCSRYKETLNTIEIEENDLVFVNLDMFGGFVSILNKNPPLHKFILVTHNSDQSFNENHLNLVRAYVNRIYAINNICRNESIVQTIPIGFPDRFKTHLFPKTYYLGKLQNITTRENLVYMNFNKQTNLIKRTECFNNFSGKPWVTNEPVISFEDFYLKVSKSKYIISPEGTGIDCHRIYEAIYFDCVPILQTSLLDNFYMNLPLLIVKHWSEINETYLNDNYDMFYRQLVDWKGRNLNWMSPSFWTNINT